MSWTWKDQLFEWVDLAIVALFAIALWGVFAWSVYAAVAHIFCVGG